MEIIIADDPTIRISYAWEHIHRPMSFQHTTLSPYYTTYHQNLNPNVLKPLSPPHISNLYSFVNPIKHRSAPTNS
ncbi:hypothetical protein VNO78_18478 [Psophocarpus tetragonolobus]|uniref:Uncharacterized protein n=1 Tax=Psophocarpus tetragonolobus TaxID=3891 RepID=A0AAN9SJE9_PSOTE